MQTFNLQFSGLSELEESVTSIDFTTAKSVLIQIFSGVEDLHVIQEIGTYLRENIPNATIIGSSTAGEICEAKMFEHSITLSFSLFEKTSLSSCLLECRDFYLMGTQIAKHIVKSDTKAVILFTSGLECDDELLLKGFSDTADNSIVVCGGVAADNAKFLNPYVFDGEKIMSEGAVAVALNSSELYVSTSYNLAWRPIGLEMTITKAEGNRVLEINHQAIKEVYQNYLGEAVVQNLPDSAMEFPIMFERDGMFIARDGIHVDDESITYGSALQVGTKVRFGIAHTLDFTSSREKNYEYHSSRPTEAVFIYSCIAKKFYFGDQLESEFQPLQTIAPTSGFFTYGEFFHTSERVNLLNNSTTVLALSESPVIAPRSTSKIPAQSRVNLSNAALVHLIDKTIAELEHTTIENQNSITVLNQYQKAIDSSYIISITDTKGNIIFANDRFCQLSGYSADELVGEPHNIVRHPDMPKETFKELWQTIQSKQIWHGVVKNRHKLGYSYYVDATIFPMLDKNENITGYVGIRDDITDIHNQKERAEAILNAQNAIVLLTKVIDGSTRIKQLNQKFFELYNFQDLDDFLIDHECICDLFIPRESYLHKMMNGKTWLEYVLDNPSNSHLALLQDPNGHENIYSVTAKAVHLETESFFIVTLTDVTELETARVTALTAEKAKSAFLATMSHELRTPLNAVIGFSQVILRKEDMSLEMMRSFVQKIHLSGKHLLDLVNNILDFSKIESDKMEIHRSTVDLNDIISESIMLIETAALKKRLRINKKDFANKTAYADPQLLKQVILNLLSNAVKFTPDGKRIGLAYKEIDEFVVIAVCDEGIGLTKEQVGVIFQPFTQIREHQNEAIKGTGLGLAISQKIIEMHDGRLEIKSQVGKGTCFRIYLPKDIQ
jgi:PAS domain S-box-containing protein